MYFVSRRWLPSAPAPSKAKLTTTSIIDNEASSTGKFHFLDFLVLSEESRKRRHRPAIHAEAFAAPHSRHALIAPGHIWHGAVVDYFSSMNTKHHYSPWYSRDMKMQMAARCRHRAIAATYAIDKAWAFRRPSDSSADDGHFGVGRISMPLARATSSKLSTPARHGNVTCARQPVSRAVGRCASALNGRDIVAVGGLVGTFMFLARLG